MSFASRDVLATGIRNMLIRIISAYYLLKLNNSLITSWFSASPYAFPLAITKGFEVLSVASAGAFFNRRLTSVSKS